MAAGKPPGVAYSLTLRADYPNRIGMLGRITSTIGEVGGDIGAIDIVSSSRDRMLRDITVNARDIAHGQEIVKRVRSIPGVKVTSVSDPTFLMHLGGKIGVTAKVGVKTRSDLSMAYTPGVARVSMAIHEDPMAVWTLTSKANTVVVVSDGSAVLGLGNIGPEAAMPVMEGKCVLFKEFGEVDAWPLCLRSQDPEQIIQTVKLVSTGFGGVNLEDISAPRCFYIEDRLREELDIPVFHDDQHGTAVVVMAAAINALKIIKKELSDIKIVVSGAGAGGIATTRMLLTAGARNIILFDRQGPLHRDRDYGDNMYKADIASKTNPSNFQGPLSQAMEGADMFIGLAGPNLLTAEDVKRMNSGAIVFAMANPDPEIWPEEALPYVTVMGTGRSDYPNQINNSLCFPGFFRGMLDVRARLVNDEMKLAAAHAIAACVSPGDLNEEYIIPSMFDRSVARNVARAVADAAHKSGVAQRAKRRLGSLSGVIH